MQRDASDDAQHARAGRRDRAEAHQIVQRQLVLAELTNGERGTIQRQRRRDDVDARAVEQARVAYRRGFIDAAADLAHDALADVHQLRIVAEADRRELHLAADFDEDAVGAIDHDVGDVVARQQRLERAIAQHVVADVLQQVFLLGDGHHHRLDRDDLVDDVADFLARRIRIELRELRQIDRVDQRVKDGGLDLVVIVRARIGQHGRRWAWTACGAWLAGLAAAAAAATAAAGAACGRGASGAGVRAGAGSTRGGAA